VANFEWLLGEGVDQATIERVPVASTLHVFLNDIRVHRDLRAEPMNHRAPIT
jgi:hypothetical protein